MARLPRIAAVSYPVAIADCRWGVRARGSCGRCGSGWGLRRGCWTLIVLAMLAGARFYAVFGPAQVRWLFLAQVLVMWLLPAIFLTREGWRAIGLSSPRGGAAAIALCVAIGVLAGLAFFAISMNAHGLPADSWIASVRTGMQLDEMRKAMGPAAIFGLLAVPVLIVTPVGEEILFRGLIQQAFAMRWNWIVGMVVNGLAFGLVLLHVHGLTHDAAGFHLRLVSGELFVLGGVALSALFTQCRMQTGSLFAAMAAHAGCNAAVISAVVLVPNG